MKKSQPFGADRLEIGGPNPSGTTVPALNAATVTGTDVNPTKFVQGTTRAKLPADDYDFWVALAGYHPAPPFGYSLARSSATPGSPVAISAGHVLNVEIDTPLPAGMGGAIAAALFILADGSVGDPIMCDWAYIDPDKPFSFGIATLGSDNPPRIDTTTLTGTGTNDLTGSRSPWPNVYRKYETTGGIRETHPTTGVPVDPDHGINFSIPILRNTNLEFSILGGDMETIARFLGFDYLKFTDSNSQVIEQLTGDIADIVDAGLGNCAIRLTRPKQGIGGRTERKLMLGNLTVNNQSALLASGKTQTLQIPCVLEGAIQDFLCEGMGNNLYYSNG